MRTVTYCDTRGWEYRVMAGISGMWKAKFSKPDSGTGRFVRVLPWRDSAEKAQRDLDLWAFTKGMTVIEESEPGILIESVCSETLDQMLDDYANGIDVAHGLFLCAECKGWTAVDNSTGNMWIEHFQAAKQAWDWLHRNDCQEREDIP